MRVTFYFRPLKGSERGTVYVNLSWSLAKGRYERYQTSTGLGLAAKDWDNEKGEPRKRFTPEVQHVREKLAGARQFAEQWYYDRSRENQPVSRAEAKKALDGFLSGNAPAAGVEGALGEFLAYHEAKNSSVGTTSRIRSLQSHLAAWGAETGRPPEFADFDRPFFQKFSVFLSKAENPKARFGKLGDATVSHILRMLKMFLRWGLENGLHANQAFAAVKVAGARGGAHVVLTGADLAAIAALDLPPGGGLDQARDLLTFQLDTAQRVTDVMNFTPEQVRGGEWHLTIGKTKAPHSVALRGAALAVLARHGGRLPQMSRTHYNKQIKELGRRAGLDEVVVLTRYVGGLPVRVEAKKWELMASHTLRRTTITRLIQKGVPESQIKKLTGQKTTGIVQIYDQSQAGDIKATLDKLGI
jgi:integrase